MIFSGRRPGNLGISGGHFTATPTWKPNWVSSQVAADDSHYIAPLACSGDAIAAMRKLRGVIGSMPGTAIIRSEPAYLYVEFRSRLMGFVDDVEFHCDGTAIQLRSSSRLGIRDFGVNRKRIESIREMLNG
jgi:uncharacterized protein (DUF1499 family)